MALWSLLTAHPVLLAAAVGVSIASAILPWARRQSRYGVAAVGVALTAGAIATGAGIASILAVILVWGIAAAVAAGTPR